MMPGRQYTPATIWWIVKRRKWLLTVPFVVCISAAVAVTLSMKDRYRAETLIFVVPQRVPENYVRPAISESIEQRLASITPQIMSASRLERIITELDLYPEKRAKRGGIDEIVEDMRDDIAVDILKGDLFKVSYSGTDPYTVMQVTQRLASLFVEENVKDREQLVVGTNQFLESQLEGARRQLEDQEHKVQEYRQRHAGELPTQTGSLLQAMQTAAFQLQGVEEGLSRDHDRRIELERTLSELTSAEAAASHGGEAAPPAAAPLPSADAQEAPPAPEAAAAPDGAATVGDAEAKTKLAQLAQLQRTLQNLELRLTPNHPDVVRTKRLIAQLESSLSGSTPDNRPPDPAAVSRRARIVQVRAQIANLDKAITRNTAEQDRLKALIDNYHQRVESEPARESELIGLTRDYDTVKATYEGLLAKKQEAAIAANLERQQGSQQFKTLDPARLPEKPYGPNRTMINGIAGGFGLALGLGVALLLEIRDQTFRTSYEVLPAIALPVLASVPVVVTAAERRRAKYVAMSVGFLSLAVIAGGAIVAHHFGMLPPLPFIKLL